MDEKGDSWGGESAPSTAPVDHFFGLAFESLRKRWDLTTDSDHTERQQIMEELRRITVDWERVLEARERTRASADARR